MSDEADLPSWLRRRVSERLYLARHAVELGNAAVWVEQSSGVLVTGEGTETDCWHGTWPMGDSSLTRLMEANDPRDTIARCEAELAILDEHGPDDTFGPDDVCCCACGDRPQVPFPCRTVRLLGQGYRFRPGYREEWKP